MLVKEYMNLIPVKICKTAYSKPVSYTHLDVYKRQGLLVMFLTTGGLQR